jgi:hypothetical protein
MMLRLVVCLFAFVLLIYVPLFGQERAASQLSDVSGREILDELQLREVASVGPTKKGGYDWARKLSPSSFTKNPQARLKEEEIFLKADQNYLDRFFKSGGDKFQIERKIFHEGRIKWFGTLQVRSDRHCAQYGSQEK